MDSMEQTSDGRPGARIMTMLWNTDAGEVCFTFPSNLSATDAADVRALLELTMRGMDRRAQAMETRQGGNEVPSQDDSAVGEADAPARTPDHTPAGGKP